jgi:hypothetical protein
MNHIKLITVDNSPLFLDGWLVCNQEVWGLKPLRVAYAPEGKNYHGWKGCCILTAKGG